MNKIRILFTIPNFNTAGSGKALLNIAKSLNPAKFEAHISCQSEAGDFFKVVKNSGIQVHVFDYIPKSRPIHKMFSEAWRVSRKFRSIHPDIIHSFHYSDNYTEGLAARLAGIKWVFTKKNMSWGGSGRGWKWRSTMAKAIAVQNTDMQIQFYPNANKTQLIPRGVNIEQFKVNEPNPEIRVSMNTPFESRIIICVANMVPVKGVELLIQAFHALANECLNWHVWLVGDINNEYGAQLLDQVAQLDLTHRIHFSGKQSNVCDYLDHAEIFVLPTKDEGRREGSPVALLEAMANGKVVIGSAVPGVKDQLQLFPQHQFVPGNWQDLGDKLQTFMQKPTEENIILGKTFVKHVMENYSIELEVKRHEDFYINITNE